MPTKEMESKLEDLLEGRREIIIHSYNVVDYSFSYA